MSTSKYAFPPALEGLCTRDAYRRWLDRKAAALRKRDRKRGNESAPVASYKQAIHAAVERDGATDAYTGRPLHWHLISKYDNEEAALKRRAIKVEFAHLPTVDHVGDGLGAPDFRICAWRTNDAKNDLSHADFVQLCESVIAHARRTPAK